MKMTMRPLSDSSPPVVAPPTNTFLQMSEEEVLEGKEVTVTCSSDGAPTPSLLLRSEEAGLLLSGPAPLSVSLQLNGSAHFHCQASNRLGVQQVNRAVKVAGMTSLPVSSWPRPQPGEPAQDSVSLSASPLQVSLGPAPPAHLGSTLVLTCRAFGCPQPPTLNWRRLEQNQTLLQGTQPAGPGEPVGSGASGEPPGEPGPAEMMSLLTLEDVDIQDQGNYSCEAQCGPVVRTRTVHVQVFCESSPMFRQLSVEGTRPRK